MASNTGKHYNKKDDGKPHRCCIRIGYTQTKNIRKERTDRTVQSEDLDKALDDAMNTFSIVDASQLPGNLNNFSVGLSRTLISGFESRSIDILTIDNSKHGRFVKSIEYIAEFKTDYTQLHSIIAEILQVYVNDYHFKLDSNPIRRLNDRLTFAAKENVATLIYKYNQCDSVCLALLLRQMQFQSLQLLDILNCYVSTINAISTSDEGIIKMRHLRRNLLCNYQNDPYRNTRRISGNVNCNCVTGTCYSLVHEENIHIFESIQRNMGVKIDDWSPLKDLLITGNLKISARLSDGIRRYNAHNGIIDQSQPWVVYQFDRALNELIANFVSISAHNNLLSGEYKLGRKENTLVHQDSHGIITRSGCNRSNRGR